MKKIGRPKGYRCSEETRKKFSERMKGNKYALGMKHTEEWNRKIGDSKRKYKTPEEAKDAHRKGDREYQQRKRAAGLVDKTEEYRSWRKKNPLGANAHYKLNYAIKNGKIKRKSCVICGKKDAYGHHQDYKKPYDVIWLCPIHHKLLHLKSRGKIPADNGN